MYRKAIAVGFLCLFFLPVVVFAAPRNPGPAAPAGKVELADPVELPIEIDGQHAVAMSPDGMKVLFVERKDKEKFAYQTVDIDGKNKRGIFESGMEQDDGFALCMGHGVWSPDGKQFAALTAEGGREDFRMLLCDVETGKTTELPRNLDVTIGAVFGADGTVYYVDCTNPEKNKAWNSVLKKYDPQTGKAAEAVRIDGGILVGIAFSPQRHRLGGIVARQKAGERDDPTFHFWALDLRSGKTAESGGVHIDDNFFRSGLVRWDADGNALIANTAEDEDPETKFSITRFEPFPGSDGEPVTKLLQEKQAVFVGAAFAPGKFSVAPKKQDGDEDNAVRAFVLDTRTDKSVECNLPLFLIDRQGGVGVFWDLRTNKLCSARILVK